MFSRKWQNFMIFGCFHKVGNSSHEVEKISRFSAIFTKLVKFHDFWLINEVDRITWFLPLFMKLAKFHDFWLFSWSWQNIMIFCYFLEVGIISWFLATFMKLAKFHDFWLFSWSWQDFMFFWLFSWSWQNFMIFGYFHDVELFLPKFLIFRQSQSSSKKFLIILMKFAEFHKFWLFYEVSRISWILVILQSWQNLMKFGYFMKLADFHEFW